MEKGSDIRVTEATVVYAEAIPNDIHTSFVENHNRNHNGFMATAPTTAIITELHVEQCIPQVQHEENETKAFMASNNWPLGLQEMFLREKNKISHRFFICDDSGSMSTYDGCMLTPAGSK